MGGDTATLRSLLTYTRDGEWGAGYPKDGYTKMRVIRGTDFERVRQGDLTTVPTRYIRTEIAARKTLRPWDILIETAGGSRDRPTGRTLLLHPGTLENVEAPLTCASFARFLRVDRNRVDASYVYWFLQCLYYNGEMERHQVQHTGVARFQFTNFADSLEIPLPSLPEQRAIAHLLGTLDDKIELNRRMNETLEEMARALFKSWFVDFDPVRAKMECRWRPGESLPGLPAEHYDLFPDRLVPSELGDIPEGWEVKTLGNVVELGYGKSLREKDREPGTVPVYGSNGQVGWHDRKLVSGPGVVVGRKGNPGTVTWCHTDFFPIDTTFYVEPKVPNLSMTFLFHALARQDLPSIAADSAVPGLNRNLAYMNLQLTPPPPATQEFDNVANRLFIRSHSLELECQALAAQRDALLPKLVSGEIRVAEAAIG